MANEADLKLIEIGEFEQTASVAGAGEEFIVVRKADGKTYKMSTADFKAFLGTVQVQVPKALAPTDPAPTLSGVYYPTITQNEAGTPIVYTNAGGIEVNTAEGGEDYGKQVQILFDGSEWAKIGIPLPERDLSGLATKSEVALSVEVAKNLTSQKVDISKPTTAGYYNRTTGAWSATANYQTSPKISVSALDIIQRKGNALNTTLVAPVAFFNESDVYLGSINVIPEDYTFKVGDLYPTASYIYVSSVVTYPIFEVYKTITIKKGNVEGLVSLEAQVTQTAATVSNLNKDISDILIEGYDTSIPAINQVNTSIKKLEIYLDTDIENLRFHRFAQYAVGSRYMVNIRGERVSDGQMIQFAYDTQNGDPFPEDIANHELALNIFGSTSDESILYISIDWTGVGTPITSIQGSPTYAQTGIRDSYIITKKNVEALKSLFGGGGSTPGAMGLQSTLGTAVVASTDAPQFFQDIANELSLSGAGIVSDSEAEINVFLDSLLSATQNYAVVFYGNFTNSLGFNKHPNVSFDCYFAKQKMGAGLGQNYRCCIRPTNGGVPSSVSYLIDHKGTYIKGCYLDGNESENPTYYNVEASGIIHAIVNNLATNDVQYAINIVVEDVCTKNFIRDGIIAGKGWKLKNITCENSREDHGLYLSGWEDTTAENITFKGTFSKGALAIAGNDLAYQKNRPTNGRFRNFSFIECGGGPMIDIRGHFPTTLYPCNAVSIDGVYIKNTSTYGLRMITIGETIDPGTYTAKDYSQGISITNLYAEVNLYNSMFLISRAGVKIGGKIVITGYRPDRPLFLLKGAGDEVLNALDLSDLNIDFRATNAADYKIFAFDNEVTPVKSINGLNISGLTIKGLSNYYLFGLWNPALAAGFTVKNLSMDNVIGTPLAVVPPAEASKITFITENKVAPIP